MKTPKILILIIIAMMMMNCSEDNDEGVVIPTTNYNLLDNCEWKNNIDLEKIYLINNLEEMKTIVNCDDLSTLNIDFDKSTLLVLVGCENYANPIRDVKLIDVKSEKYILNVIFATNLSPTISPWVISLIIPKLVTSTNIEVKKEFQ